MKKFSYIILFLLTSMVMLTTSYAADQSPCKENHLTAQRISTIKEYLKLLGEGKYKEIIPFFTPNAVLSDPIKGLTTPAKYYNGLYGYLTYPKVTVYDIYVGTNDPDILAAHFTMKVEDKQDEIKNRGQIVDLFVFAPDSTKFAKLYIQNNMTDYEFTKN